MDCKQDEFKRMNEHERNSLKEKVKAELHHQFDLFDSNLYSNSDNLSNKNQKEKLEEVDIVELVSYVLNASKKSIKLECDFTNEFLEGDTRSGKFFVYGDTKIDENLENVISMNPSSHFTYEYEGDVSDEPTDYSGDLISHLKISDVNMYKGTFSYIGIVNEDSAMIGAPLEVMKLFNEVQIRYIEDSAPAWEKHMAASYRLYDGKSYKLAFLTAFIGLDSLIEFLTSRIKDVYYWHVNDGIDFSLKNYDSAKWDAIRLMREEVIKSESLNRLERLENPNRKLINQKMLTILKFATEWSNEMCEKHLAPFDFFEKIRNSLAHGNDYQKEEIQSKKIYQLYKKDGANDIDFDKLYVGFFISICDLIKTLID